MYTLRRFRAILLLFSFILSSCGSSFTPVVATVPPAETQPAPVPTQSAFETGVYPNLFTDYLGKSDEEIQAKINEAWDQLFYGDDSSERVYYPVGADMAYILDTGNDDVRSEGMSYGMMIAVQLNKKEEFDRIWKWTKTYMYQTDGGYKGYFAWHNKPDGTKLASNPASDGEEWFIMALMFADGRWGSGEGTFGNYRAEAQSILDVSLHVDELGGDLATNLFDAESKQVVFVPQLGKNSSFTDPSYHLPHYYELWALWADKDNQFWADAAQVSRDYLKTAVHPQTGLAPNYSYFDGKPYDDEYNGNFRYDAFRVGANVGMDYVWFRPSPSTGSGQVSWHVEQSNRMLDFFASQGIDEYKAEYTLEGEPEVEHRSTGLIATNAVAALAADPEKGKPFVQALWDQVIPTGQYRYYDGLLSLLGLLQVSGNFRIYEPGSAPENVIFTTPAPEVKGKFAPPTGRALLFIGQDKKSIDAYFDKLVMAPGGLAVNTSLQLNGIKDFDYLAGRYPNSTLSVGLDLKGVIDDVAAGSADAKIDAVLDALSTYNRPVFLRLGYGFDDPANKYEPDVYVSAWKNFHGRIQAKGSTQVALVWQSASLCGESNGGHPLVDWYPGDKFVDWVGANYGECVDEVVQFAREHYKPVMLEAATQGAGSDANEIWNGWFAPFFKFVDENNDVVRAVAYVNDGDSRIQLNDEIIKRWKDETKQPFWLRGGPDLFDTLGFAE
ncbi:MAG: glycosyl hydrolase family 8 [Anaerolineales bacterium]